MQEYFMVGYFPELVDGSKKVPMFDYPGNLPTTLKNAKKICFLKNQVFKDEFYVFRADLTLIDPVELTEKEETTDESDPGSDRAEF